MPGAPLLRLTCARALRRLSGSTTASISGPEAAGVSGRRSSGLVSVPVNFTTAPQELLDSVRKEHPDYLGYYDICYIGDEVKNPGRTIPRSVIISVVAVALIYILINLSIIGVVPWRQFVPAEATKPFSDFVVSVMMEKIYGRPVAVAVTLMILWTAFGSVFALLLGYSRIPYAAARDGYFFSVFGKLHPQHNFPYVSLLAIGAISIVCSFLSLGTVIDALIALRILVQFIGQIVAVTLLREVVRTLPSTDEHAPVGERLTAYVEHLRSLILPTADKRSGRAD